MRWRNHSKVLVASLVPAVSKSTKHSPESLSISSLGCHRRRSRIRLPFRYFYEKILAKNGSIPMADGMFSTATSRTGCSQYYRLSYTRLVPFAGCSMAVFGRDRFDSTASAGRRIPSASPIDLSEPIPEDPLPSSTPLHGRR